MLLFNIESIIHLRFWLFFFDDFIWNYMIFCLRKYCLTVRAVFIYWFLDRFWLVWLFHTLFHWLIRLYYLRIMSSFIYPIRKLLWDSFIELFDINFLIEKGIIFFSFIYEFIFFNFSLLLWFLRFIMLQLLLIESFFIVWHLDLHLTFIDLLMQVFKWNINSPNYLSLIHYNYHSLNTLNVVIHFKNKL